MSLLTRGYESSTQKSTAETSGTEDGRRRCGLATVHIGGAQSTSAAVRTAEPDAERPVDLTLARMAQLAYGVARADRRPPNGDMFPLRSRSLTDGSCFDPSDMCRSEQDPSWHRDSSSSPF